MAQRGFVPPRLSVTQRVALGVLVVTAAATFVTVRIAFREKETVAIRPVLTVATTTTTTAPPTTAAPTTTTVPFDDPEVCQARDLVTAAGSTLGAEQDIDVVVSSLGSMSTGLGRLSASGTHEELSSAAEVVKPVVDEAMAAVQASSSAGLELVAADPRFADPEILEAMGVIFSFPLNCAPA